jgi:hypothetical protein
VSEQLRLYSSLTGTTPAAPVDHRAMEPQSQIAAEGARIVPLPRRAG